MNTTPAGPTPTYPCPNCGKPWYSAAVADDCCGSWLGYEDEGPWRSVN